MGSDLLVWTKPELVFVRWIGWDAEVGVLG